MRHGSPPGRICGKDASFGTYIHSASLARIQTARNLRWVLVRQVIHETGFPRPIEINLERTLERGITSFADRLLIVGYRHAAAVVGAIKVHHYLWNVRRCFELVESLSDAALFEAGRIRSTRICVEVLYRVALLPGVFCVEQFTHDEVERAKRRLCIMLDALSTSGGSAAYRRWCHRTASVLRDPSENTWHRFIEASGTLGRRHRCFRMPAWYPRHSPRYRR